MAEDLPADAEVEAVVTARTASVRDLRIETGHRRG
jgi:hypothetical protein